MAVNRVRLQALVEAAKSGKYRQTQGQLREDIDGVPCFCFEGLACELSGVGEWVQVDVDEQKFWQYSVNGYITSGLLHSRVAEYYGLPHLTTAKVGDRDAPLFTLNDWYGYSLLQIAEGLEAKYLQGEHATS